MQRKPIVVTLKHSEPTILHPADSKLQPVDSKMSLEIISDDSIVPPAPLPADLKLKPATKRITIKKQKSLTMTVEVQQGGLGILPEPSMVKVLPNDLEIKHVSKSISGKKEKGSRSALEEAHAQDDASGLNVSEVRDKKWDKKEKVAQSLGTVDTPDADVSHLPIVDLAQPIAKTVKSKISKGKLRKENAIDETKSSVADLESTVGKTTRKEFKVQNAKAKNNTLQDKAHNFGNGERSKKDRVDASHNEEIKRIHPASNKGRKQVSELQPKVIPKIQNLDKVMDTIQAKLSPERVPTHTRPDPKRKWPKNEEVFTVPLPSEINANTRFNFIAPSAEPFVPRLPIFTHQSFMPHYTTQPQQLPHLPPQYMMPQLAPPFVSSPSLPYMARPYPPNTTIYAPHPFISHPQAYPSNQPMWYPRPDFQTVGPAFQISQQELDIYTTQSVATSRVTSSSNYGKASEDEFRPVKVRSPFK